jgi:hypothetical protein
MSKSRNIILGLLAGLILIGALLVLVIRQATGEYAAREKLDHLLGQSQPDWQDAPDSSEAPPLPPPEPPALPDNNHGGSFFGLPLPMPQAGVDVQETNDSYILRIPLADPKDASSIKLNVTPNRIEVSGQTGSKENGISASSSFMQAFTTSQEVMPGQISRRTEQNGDTTQMVITIPKKQLSPDEDNQTLNTQDTQSQPDSNDLPPAPPNPLDGVENKVI